MAIVGYADLHCHPMAHLGFGGIRSGRAFFWGTPTDPVEQALPCCTAAHDLFRGGGLLPLFTEHEGVGYDGYDTFGAWPRNSTLIHQQMYVDCIERAFRGGLRLMVASAVNSELLADLYQGRGVDSRDETAVVAQIQGMEVFANRYSDWVRIVTTPAQARDAIESGMLAIVLAIEVDSIAGGAMRRGEQLSPEQAKAVVKQWWDVGIRLINPIHLVDNALGGTAVYDDRFNCSNHYVTRKWASELPQPWFWQAEAASGELADVRFLLGANPDNILLIQLYDQSYPTYIKSLGRGGHVNARGLSLAGEAFLQAMMDRGMLIDVEHMSARTLDATIQIAQARGYPLISSHTGLRSLAKQRPDDALYVKGCANESMRSDRQLLELKNLGSVVGIGGHVGMITDLTTDTSAAWARAYKHAQEIGFDSIAIGTDMNGLAGAPGPRFVADEGAPGGLRPLQPGDPVRPIRYGADFVPVVQQALEQTALGRRKYSFNTDGLAHYGLLPDFTLDVALSLGGQESLRAFFGSAEAFILAWERCVGDR